MLPGRFAATKVLRSHLRAAFALISRASRGFTIGGGSLAAASPQTPWLDGTVSALRLVTCWSSDAARLCRPEGRTGRKSSLARRSAHAQGRAVRASHGAIPLMVRRALRVLALPVAAVSFCGSSRELCTHISSRPIVTLYIPSLASPLAKDLDDRFAAVRLDQLETAKPLL
jgi:hypothetical protein